MEGVEEEAGKEEEESKGADRLLDRGEREGEWDREGQEPRRRRGPKTPTQEEWENHQCTHIPFRSWCKHCVEGRGGVGQRREEDDQEDDHLKIRMDYCYL